MHNLIIRDGTSQAMRALPPLQDRYFDLDEMTFHELLDIVVEFAALVRFHNAQDLPEGDWSPFFRADETVVMSRILAFDLTRETARFAQWWRDTPEYDGVSATGAGLRSMLRASPVPALIETLNGWYEALSQAQSDNGLGLRTVLRAVIMQLSRRETGVLGALESAQLRVPLDPVWTEAPTSVIAQAGDAAARPPAARPGLSKADVRADFHAYMKAIEMVRAEALARLPASLHSGTHDPAVGLLIAFVRQFEKLQSKLNGYTQKFIDFYYERMLGSVPRGVVPDRTWLVMRRNPDAGDVVVPAGTAFPAGIDAQGHDILYRSEDELRVSGARVSRVQTLYLDHNGYSMPENLLPEDADAGKSARKWPTAAWFDEVPCTPPGTVHSRAWPILGAPKPGAGIGQHSAARIGFALASKVLLLKEGERVVTLTITFADDRLVTRLAEVADAVFGRVPGESASREGDESGEVADQMHLRRQDLYLKMLRSLFSVALTGETGWIEIAGYVPWLEDREMRLSFVVPPQAPSIVRYSPALHGEAFDVDTPLVRCVINPGAYLFPYGLLRNLPVTGARIDVEALGCRDLVLYNNIGQLSAATPFAPFGPIPRLGSYLVAGSTEMASKRISRFRLRIEWADLPRVTGGFGTWYDGYDVRVTNEDYLASVEVLAKGGWLPAGDPPRPVVPLFHTRVTPGKGERIDNTIVWDAGSLVHLFEPDAGVGPAHPLTWGPGAKNGFFKFTFAAPAFAFGHEV
ncbi:hypothetical protein AB870_22790 [Pandoraea faecigallinarum]|uniref:Baseplate protein J-like domain-containing protein n=1 Tax=Pandoraea faecigallinarum TaxID=656179 RepID=A0A0H3X034_9BURK|nr:hypothetical protein [Pandoraea faecigallinarum]AKM32318.1 hypothetical protein AB870_22790 [Pandoraea faecigallinarum]